jgi:hypothetical protein
LIESVEVVSVRVLLASPELSFVTTSVSAF